MYGKGVKLLRRLSQARNIVALMPDRSYLNLAPWPPRRMVREYPLMTNDFAQPSRARRIFGVVFRLLLLGGLAAGGWYGYKQYKKNRDKPPEYATEAVVIAPSIVEKTTATGTLQALVTVQIGAQISGRIIKLYADFNSVVTKDQLLAELDPTLLKTQVAQARATLENQKAGVLHAQAAVRAAERVLSRNRKLYEQKLATEADFDTSKANHELAIADHRAAEAQVVQARAALDLQETNLAYTKIYSPIDGVVLSRSVDVGQTVAASLQAPVLFSIAKDLGQMQLHANVDEADIGKLRKAMPAKFTVDAFRGEIFHGTINELRLSPQVVQNVVTYDAVIDVPNLGNKLRPGMTATVTFETQRRLQVLAVPNGALRYHPAADELLDEAHGKTGDNTAEAKVATPTADDADLTKAEKKARKKAKREQAAARLASEASASGDDGNVTPSSKVYRLRDKALQQIELTVGVTDGRFSEVLTGDLQVGDLLVVRRLDVKDAGSKGSGGPGGGGGGARMPKKLF